MKASNDLLIEFSDTYLELTIPWISELVNENQRSHLKAMFAIMATTEDLDRRKAAREYVEKKLEGIVDKDGDLISKMVARKMFSAGNDFRSLFVDSEVDESYIFFWINLAIKEVRLKK